MMDRGEGRDGSTGHAPRLVRAFVGATLQVLLLTYVIMPRITRLLARWLYPRPS
jgi:antibiotic biosynthesis monooxygenase (ABM) superfamily enzyme